ncbi:hypothetical protein PCASD_00972 [Puccinia coronata f. sp. avenae]|uniref:Uncharacterized protein n=1 Tax=Puccinia coronata f. sp. avenae TaxID=200324 RepID=A0A2N5VMS2_9BASI|nr:hypothetical protein PCASD_00972 [Puccinia coronata f. sp. avenae]
MGSDFSLKLQDFEAETRDLVQQLKAINKAAIPTSAGAATREVETTALAAELAASLQKSGNQRASAAIQSMVGQMNPKDQEKYKARMDKVCQQIAQASEKPGPTGWLNK